MKQIIIFSLIILLSSCASRDNQFDQFYSAFDSQKSKDFSDKLDEFFRLAKEGKDSEILSITSKEAISDFGGPEKTKEFYKNQIIPVFAMSLDIVDINEPSFIRDQYGNSGWKFQKVFKVNDDKNVKLEFVVIRSKEDRNLYLTAIQIIK